jgi:hypothetical protein
MTQSQPEEFFCTDCGGTNIIAEATCYWDITTQKWAHFEVADEGWDNCADCGHDGADFRTITDIKSLAQIAIKKQEATQ